MLLSFFFSSRRRHTRFDCDWSSDVCSSDLLLEQGVAFLRVPLTPAEFGVQPGNPGLLLAGRRGPDLAPVLDDEGVDPLVLEVEDRAELFGREDRKSRRVGKECRCRW